MVESSVLFPVAIVLSLGVNWRCVTFPCSVDYSLNRWPVPRPQSSGVSKTICPKRNGIHWMQEGVATSSTDVAEQFSHPTEVSNTSKESVSVEQGQPLRAAKPDQCVSKVKAKPILETPTQRQRDIFELTLVSWYSVCVHGRAADDSHRRRQDSRSEDASFDHADIAVEARIDNKKLKFTVLVNHNSGSVATLKVPKDVIEYVVRFPSSAAKPCTHFSSRILWTTPMHGKSNFIKKRMAKQYFLAALSVLITCTLIVKRNACGAKEHETSSGQQNKVVLCLTSTVALRCIPADGTFAALTFEDHDFLTISKECSSRTCLDYSRGTAFVCVRLLSTRKMDARYWKGATPGCSLLEGRDTRMLAIGRARHLGAHY